MRIDSPSEHVQVRNATAGAVLRLLEHVLMRLFMRVTNTRNGEQSEPLDKRKWDSTPEKECQM